MKNDKAQDLQQEMVALSYRANEQGVDAIMSKLWKELVELVGEDAANNWQEAAGL